MKRFLPLLTLTGLLFGQDTTIVLENGSTVSGTIISETDSTYRIMGESWRVTDGVYEVFNTFINISKNETEGEAAQKAKEGCGCITATIAGTVLFIIWIFSDLPV